MYIYIYIMGKIISGKPQIERDVMVILQIDGWWYIQVTLRCS